MSQDDVAYACPHCGERDLEAVATLPYVRGYVLAFKFGSKKILGCRKCVRLQLLKETGISSTVGWFSPTALFSNPFLIVYGLGRTACVRRNPNAVRKQLESAGIPEPQAAPNLVRIGYSLAASMIAADEKIQDEEISTAADIGERIFDGFDRSEFNGVVANHSDLPEPAELASVLSTVLDDASKEALYGYLLAIAASDDDLATEEKKLLDTVAENMKMRVAA